MEVADNGPASNSDVLLMNITPIYKVSTGSVPPPMPWLRPGSASPFRPFSPTFDLAGLHHDPSLDGVVHEDSHPTSKAIGDSRDATYIDISSIFLLLNV